MTVSPLTSFNIANIFLLRLWPLFENKVQEAAPDLLYVHSLFFETICFEAESYDEWKEAIFRVMGAEPTAETKIPLGDVYNIMLEFVWVYNETFPNQLQYAIEYLMAIRDNPQDFPSEQQLWKIVVEEVTQNQKYICSPNFWEAHLKLGRFKTDNPENRETIMQLFKSPSNAVSKSGSPNASREVYLKDIGGQKQLWGYVLRDKILDAGIIDYAEEPKRVWLSDPLHENGGYLAAEPK